MLSASRSGRNHCFSSRIYTVCEKNLCRIFPYSHGAFEINYCTGVEKSVFSAHTHTETNKRQSYALGCRLDSTKREIPGFLTGLFNRISRFVLYTHSTDEQRTIVPTAGAFFFFSVNRSWESRDGGGGADCFSGPFGGSPVVVETADGNIIYRRSKLR